MKECLGLGKSYGPDTNNRPHGFGCTRLIIAQKRLYKCALVFQTCIVTQIGNGQVQ